MNEDEPKDESEMVEVPDLGQAVIYKGGYDGFVLLFGIAFVGIMILALMGKWP